MFVASTGNANLPVPREEQQPHICQMWSYSPTAESTDLKAGYQWPAVNNHYVTVPCECRHQCLFLSLSWEAWLWICRTFNCLLDHATHLPGDMCTILYDVIKTVLLSLPAWHTRLFTDSIHNIPWILHRGNRRWDCATVCWQAVRVPGPLPSSREPGASTCNVFGRIHTAHVWPERVVLTREANVWKRRSFSTFLPCFEYRTTGQTAAHFRQVTSCAKIPTHSSVSAQLWIIMRKLRRAHHQIYPWLYIMGSFWGHVTYLPLSFKITSSTEASWINLTRWPAIIWSNVG